MLQVKGEAVFKAPLEALFSGLLIVEEEHFFFFFFKRTHTLPFLFCVDWNSVNVDLPQNVQCEVVPILREDESVFIDISKLAN